MRKEYRGRPRNNNAQPLVLEGRLVMPAELQRVHRAVLEGVEITADSDDPGQGFQLKAATIPIEGGQYWPVGTFMGSQRW
jgi:hypothetical protein